MDPVGEWLAGTRGGGRIVYVPLVNNADGRVLSGDRACSIAAAVLDHNQCHPGNPVWVVADAGSYLSAGLTAQPLRGADRRFTTRGDGRVHPQSWIEDWNADYRRRLALLTAGGSKLAVPSSRGGHSYGATKKSRSNCRNRCEHHVTIVISSGLRRRKLVSSEPRLALMGFESDEQLNHVLSRVPTWPEPEVRRLLRVLLLPSVALGHDKLHLQIISSVLKSPDNEINKLRSGPLFTSEYTYRVLRYYKAKVEGRNESPPWEGITWLIDLLPHWPGQALSALNSYILAHAQVLPDGRMNALNDAAAIIRAHYIGSPETAEERRQILFTIDSRMFEALVAALYDALGYSTDLTVASGDGGRDIVAVRDDPTRRTQLQIQCKRWRKAVPVEKARQLLGVLTDKDTGCVLVSTSSFTRGSKREAARSSRIELITGRQLVVLLNEHLGSKWPVRMEQICRERIAKPPSPAHVTGFRSSSP